MFIWLLFFLLIFFFIIFFLIFSSLPVYETIPGTCPSFGSLTTQCRALEYGGYQFTQYLFTNGALKQTDAYLFLTNSGTEITFTNGPSPLWSATTTGISAPTGKITRNGDLVFLDPEGDQFSFYDGMNIIFPADDIFYYLKNENGILTTIPIEIADYVMLNRSFFTPM